MRENVQDKHALGSIIDPGNQPVVVAVDIEHGSATHDIRMREVLPHIGQRAQSALLVIRYQFIRGTKASWCLLEN